MDKLASLWLFVRKFIQTTGILLIFRTISIYLPAQTRFLTIIPQTTHNEDIYVFQEDIEE